jgi:hypothetical protein
VVAGAAGAWSVSRVISGAPGETGHQWALSEQEAPVVAAYLYAGSHRAEAERIPCYCGCWDLDHGSLLDCFIAKDGGYEEHASFCTICLDELGDLRRILDSGEGVDAARTYIDATYSGLGKPTDTP